MIKKKIYRKKMSVVFTCLLTWAYIEWCYIGQLSQFGKRYRSLFLFCVDTGFMA